MSALPAFADGLVGLDPHFGGHLPDRGHPPRERRADTEDSGARSGAAPDAAIRSQPWIRGYRIERRLAEGGSGSVYLARELATAREVAVKIVAAVQSRNGASDDMHCLRREFDLLRRLDSRCIVSTHARGAAGRHDYLAMEYFPHGTLRDQMLGPLPSELALDYATQIARALEVVHGAGILHCDVKPANFMLRDDATLALIDFGSARDAARNAALARSGIVVGTPYYMSPEHCSGGAELTAASDLYALGAVLYEMLTGDPPYRAPTPTAVMRQHQFAPLPRLPEMNAGLQPLLDRLLAKRPEDRFATAAELRRHLAAVGGA